MKESAASPVVMKKVPRHVAVSQPLVDPTVKLTARHGRRKLGNDASEHEADTPAEGRTSR